MGGREQDAKLFAESAEVVSAGSGHQHGSEFVGVNDFVILEESALLQETQVKTDIVSNNRRVTDKSFKIVFDLLKARRVAYFHITDASQPCDKFRNVPARVDDR